MSLPWRPILAVTAVVALATGGALLTLLPASSGEKDLVVTTPTDASTTDARSVVVAGTGVDGALVRIYDDNSNAILLGSTEVVDGTFSTVVEYADDAAPQQGLYVDALVGDDLLDADTLTITLPSLETGAGADSSSGTSSSAHGSSSR
jgi:hypothetical protein